MIVDERTLIYSISSTIHKGYRRQSRSGSCSALARRTLARSPPHLRRVGGVVAFFVACDGSSRVIPKCQFCVLECPFVFTTRSLYPPGEDVDDPNPDPRSALGQGPWRWFFRFEREFPFDHRYHLQRNNLHFALCASSPTVACDHCRVEGLSIVG